VQRHVGPRLSNSGYPASGDGGVAAGAPTITTRSLLARDKDPMDYDMTEDLNAALLISPRTHPVTVTSLVPPMDDKLSKLTKTQLCLLVPRTRLHRKNLGVKNKPIAAPKSDIMTPTLDRGIEN